MDQHQLLRVARDATTRVIAGSRCFGDRPMPAMSRKRRSAQVEDQCPATHGYPVRCIHGTVDVLGRVESALSRAS